MKYEDFTFYVEGVRARVDRIHEATLRTRADDLLPEAVEELRSSYEELRVADEELHQQQEALLASHEIIESERKRYEDFFEFAPVAYLITDPDGVILEANRAATEMLGVTRRFLIRKPLGTYVASDDRRLFRELLPRLRRVPRVQDFALRLRPRQTALVDAALTASAVRDPLGHLTGIRWMLRDISVQTQAQEKIRLLNDELWQLNKSLEQRIAERAQEVREAHRAQDEAYALLQTLLSAADVGVAFFDTHLNYRRVNEAFMRVIGVASDALVGTRCGEVSPERSPIAVEHLQRVLETRAEIEEVEAATRSVAAPGEICIWLTSYYPVFLDGELIAVGVVVMDITNRKSAEARIAEEYAREHRIAETLQRALLQSVPKDTFAGVEVETLYQSALDEAAVGGDFFDAFALRGGRVALVVGDVSGKGLAAAGRTAEVKYALRALLHEYQAPEIALARLNDFICETHRHEPDSAETFIIAAVAVLNPATGDAVFSAAGAEPTLILRTDGSVESVETVGWPLGIYTNAEYVSKSLPIARGETILMATDGITEARCGYEFLGSDGMAALAEQAGPTLPLSALSRDVHDGARAFAGGRLHDDVCLLLARRQ